MFGMKPNPPASDILQYTGVLLVILGGVAFSMVQVDRSIPETQRMRAGKSKEEGTASDDRKETRGSSEMNSDKSSTSSSAEQMTNQSTATQSSQQSTATSASQRIPISRVEKAVCIGVAIMAGVFYGLNFVPVIYMVDNPQRYPGYPVDGLSYVFSHFFGIFLSATAIFLGYTLFKKGEPFMTSQMVLPSFLAGLLWATAQTAFFIANQHLSQAISFPIITGLPGCVASLWGVLYFKEVKVRHFYV
ncbi:hypothetical protein COOONC_10387 [Cooperia oncophora]